MTAASSPYRLDLLIRPGTTPPAKYATSVDRVYEHDFTPSAGRCCRCSQHRYLHLWTLWDGDHLIDCATR